MSVGDYAIAFNLTMFPLSRIVAPLQSITFSAFSKMQNDRRALATGWLRSVALVALVVAPAMLGMMVVAPLFVPVVLGDHWLETVPVIQALSWVGLLVDAPAGRGASALLAVNRSGTYLRFTVVTSVANIAAVVIGLPGDRRRRHRLGWCNDGAYTRLPADRVAGGGVFLT